MHDNNKVRKKLRIVLIVLLVMLWLPGFITKAVGSDTSPESTPRVLGSPVITNTYSPLERYSIDQIVDTGQYVYILFGEHDGNVQVFNKSGEYVYSAYFYTHLNGAFSIAANEDILYVRDERHNIYVLQNGELLYYIPRDSKADRVGNLRFDTSSPSYFVRMGSVWHVANGQEACFLKRPLRAALFQNNFLFVTTSLLVVFIGVTRLYLRRKEY